MQSPEGSAIARHARTAAKRVVAATCVSLAAMIVVACNDSVSTPKQQAPASILLLSGNTQKIQVATTAGVPLTVEVHDKNNVPVAGAIVTFTTTSNGGFDAPTAVTDSAGDASVMFTMGTVEGADSITASVAGVATPVVFVLTASPGPPQQLDPVGTPQETGSAGTPLPVPFSIEVVDLFGNPIAGVTVTWSTTGGTLSALTSVTDAAGMASVDLTPGSGTQTVTANVPDVSPTTFLAVGT